MGSDDGGALTGGVGVSVSDWENWASLGKFVEILGVRDVGLVCALKTGMICEREL